MGLQSLLLCSDEKVVRVLRRVLSDLEVGMEHCRGSEDAIRKLTRQTFEAIIVDCGDADSAAQVLKSVRTSPCNKRAVAVGIIDGQTNLHSAFEMGAHFVLYKPISSERAKSSFRAVRALMKCERRRNFRLPIQVPVTFSGAVESALTLDLSEGGLAVQAPRGVVPVGRLRLTFTLPEADTPIQTAGEIAWEGANGHAGIRFIDLPSEARKQLKAWLNSNVPQAEQDDPPVRCRLTDLSLGGCYLETSAPFPKATRVALSMRVADLEVRAEGLVRVMHPEIGMGIEFTQKTAEQHQHVEKFIHALTDSQGALPDLLVEPEGLESEGSTAAAHSREDIVDPLLSLFRHRAGLPIEAFLGELRKQRRSQSMDPAETVFEI